MVPGTQVLWPVLWEGYASFWLPCDIFCPLYSVGLTVSMEQADMLASRGTPGCACLPPGMASPSPFSTPTPSCLWKGLLAPFEITAERAAVCRPPPEPWNWAVVNLLEEFPWLKQKFAGNAFILCRLSGKKQLLTYRASVTNGIRLK